MNRAASFALLPFSGLYGASVKARLALYKSGLLRTRRLGAPVISVGNITAGGTGKTPLVEWIARYLAREGYRTCILTRGYGRANERERALVSDGKTILADANQAGDEGLLLAERLKGQVAVIADVDRVAAAQWAMDSLKSDVFILDDGFQNLRVARDLNIATIDATNPWSNGRLLPAGLLRELRSGLARADCIVVTRVDQSNSIDALRKEIRRFSDGRPAILSRMKTRELRRISAAKEDVETRHEGGSAAAAFCGIGNPQSFFSHLRREGRGLCYTRAFPDHHKYTQSEIDELVGSAIARGARALLTTAKDEVKLRSLRFDLPCSAVDIEIDLEDDEMMRQLISRAIQRA